MSGEPLGPRARDQHSVGVAALSTKSALARWYQKKFGKGNSRIRKIGIVALVRKLLIAFWRYLDTGLIREGAVLRA